MKNVKPKISIVVSTVNRAEHLLRCLAAFQKSTFSDYEVIVIDQSTINPMQTIEKAFPNDTHIRYYHISQKNLSVARNYGIEKTNADIVAFTDDDCIVSNNWLREIHHSLTENSHIMGVTGKTLAFGHPPSPRHICPCTFDNGNRPVIIRLPCYHVTHIGFGNNMAFKKEVFKKLGGYKPWLGLGSVGKSAEDAEFFLRLLVLGYPLIYNPKSLVYHDRWVSHSILQEFMYLYERGEFACYGYFALQGVKEAQRVVVGDIQGLAKKVSLSRIFLKELWSAICGIGVAVYFALADPYPRRIKEKYL